MANTKTALLTKNKIYKLNWGEVKNEVENKKFTVKWNSFAYKNTQIEKRKRKFAN